MKLSLKIIITIVLIATTSFTTLAQNNKTNKDSLKNDNIIIITKTQIVQPPTYDFGNVQKGSQAYAKFIIKNQRPNTIEITNIITPSGFGASMQKPVIKPKGQSEVYVGFDSNWIEADSTFEETIILETNLIKNISIKVKGKIINNSDEK
jgi:hypothetical protein